MLRHGVLGPDRAAAAAHATCQSALWTTPARLARSPPFRAPQQRTRRRSPRPQAQAQSPATVPRGVQYRPALSRQTADPLPPTGSKATGLVQLDEDLWCLRQDFWVTQNIYMNSHIARLADGSLLLVSPPARTQEAEALLDSLPGGCGAVRHVALPSLSPEHWVHAAGWAPRLSPHATVWAVPGLMEGRAAAGLLGGAARAAELADAFGGRVAQLPGAGPLPGLEGQVEAATFREAWGLFAEAALFLRDCRAVTFSDLAFGMYEHPVSPILGSTALGEGIGSLVGIYRRLGAPLATPIMLKDAAAGRAWLDQLLAWDFDRVLPGHLDPVVGQAAGDGKRLVREAFGFLLAEGQGQGQGPEVRG